MKINRKALTNIIFCLVIVAECLLQNAMTIPIKFKYNTNYQ